MSCQFNTYELLVENLGEAKAYELCEKLGGLEIEIPKKAHKTYRIRETIKILKPLILQEPKSKKVIVGVFSKYEDINKSHIYKIIREIEYGK